MVYYAERVERRMKVLFGRLSEKDRRRYAAVEADKLGHGGQQYIADHCCPVKLEIGIFIAVTN
jgi:hypothetical protein